MREKEESLQAEAASTVAADQNGTSLEVLAAKQRTAGVPAIVACSGKMVLLDKLLPKLKAEGHRVLIFSQVGVGVWRDGQFVKMLDILEEYCQLRQYRVARIDGQTKGTDRQEAIDAFSSANSPYFIFLLSTRAGGLGINLTAADTVIIYDPWWNPAAEAQAEDRSHRIGQTRAVTCIKLIVENSVEEKVLELQKLKADLFENLVESPTEALRSISLEDLEFLLT